MRVRVVIFNAHFGAWPGTIRTRADKCASMLRHMKNAASTVIMIQEAGAYLVRLCTDPQLRTSFTQTHAAYAMPNQTYGLLTLVPHGMLESERARVQMYTLPSAMNRQFHVLYVGDLALVNTHLESCAENRAVRDAQVGKILTKCAGFRTAIFGDLNGFRGLWDNFIADGAVTVTNRKKSAFNEISPHRRYTFEVA